GGRGGRIAALAALEALLTRAFAALGGGQAVVDGFVAVALALFAALFKEVESIFGGIFAAARGACHLFVALPRRGVLARQQVFNALVAETVVGVAHGGVAQDFLG